MNDEDKQDILMENITIPLILAIHDSSDNHSAKQIRDEAKKIFEEHCKKYGDDRNRLYLKLEQTLEAKRKQRSSNGMQLYPYENYNNLATLLMPNNINNENDSVNTLKKDDAER